MALNRIILIYPKRDGRILGKAHGAPYTLMRLASMVPDSIPVEIWDENLMRLPLETLRPGDLVGASAMTLGIDQVRGFAGLHAAPELLLGLHQDTEIERVHRDGDLHPFAAPGDDREHRLPKMGHPHIVLELGHVLLGCGLLVKRPWQHEFGLEYGLDPLHDPIERCRHPGNGRMLDPALDLFDGPAGVALVPGAVERLCGGPELHDQVARQVLRLSLAAFLAPEPNQRSLVASHDNPGVGAADENTPVRAEGLSRIAHDKSFAIAAS